MAVSIIEVIVNRDRKPVSVRLRPLQMMGESLDGTSYPYLHQGVGDVRRASKNIREGTVSKYRFLMIGMNEILHCKRRNMYY